MIWHKWHDKLRNVMFSIPTCTISSENFFCLEALPMRAKLLIVHCVAWDWKRLAIEKPSYMWCGIFRGHCCRWLAAYQKTLPLTSGNPRGLQPGQLRNQENGERWTMYLPTHSLPIGETSHQKKSAAVERMGLTLASVWLWLSIH